MCYRFAIIFFICHIIELENAFFDILLAYRLIFASFERVLEDIISSCQIHTLFRANFRKYFEVFSIFFVIFSHFSKKLCHSDFLLKHWGTECFINKMISSSYHRIGHCIIRIFVNIFNFKNLASYQTFVYVVYYFEIFFNFFAF